MNRSCIVLGLALAMAGGIQAEEGHHEGHEHGQVAGPKGGKLLESKPQHSEFWVNADRKVEVTFYDEGLQPVASGDHTIRVTAQAPGGSATLTMEKSDSAFVSAEPLPEGDGYNVVVQIKSDAAGSWQNFRIPYHAETCGECQLAEYACICGH